MQRPRVWCISFLQTAPRTWTHCARAQAFSGCCCCFASYTIYARSQTHSTMCLHFSYSVRLFCIIINFFPFSFFVVVRYALHFFIHLPGLHCLIKKMFETNTGWCRRFFHLLYCGDGGSSSTMASSVAKTTGKLANRQIIKYITYAQPWRRRYS